MAATAPCTRAATRSQVLFDRWMKGSWLVGERTEVRFVGNDVAIVHAIGGTITRGESTPAPERDSIQTLVAVRDEFSSPPASS